VKSIQILDDGKTSGQFDGAALGERSIHGQMVWDFTCLDTLATSHLNRSVLFAGNAVNETESRKVMKYRSLLARYNFVPVVVKSRGALGEEASDFFRNHGHRIIPVPDAAAECRCATWQRRVCVGN